MNIKAFVGAAIAYTYNHWVGWFPFRPLRHSLLKFWLGRFGKGSCVQIGSRFLNGRKVYLGERNVVNAGCLLDGRRYRICIGNDVSIGPEATILTLGHDPHSAHFLDRGGDVIIGNHVWIAYRAVILPGVSIGDGAVVAAGAVVTRDIEPYAIMAGVPARKIGERNPEIGYRLNFNPLLF